MFSNWVSQLSSFRHQEDVNQLILLNTQQLHTQCTALVVRHKQVRPHSGTGADPSRLHTDAGYYGLSLVVGSYTVFFASLAAHLFQFGFLVFFENPHIERTYGERVPLAQRVPLKSDLQEPSSQSEGVPKGAAPLQDSTPSQTDASTDTETDEPAELPQAPPRRRPRRSTTSTFGADRAFTQKETSLITQLTQHDLNSRYFQHEAVVFTNWDPLRSRDVGFGLAVFYVVVASIMPYFSQQNRLALLLAHAAAWRLFHSFCLGLMLKKQSESKWMVRHFIKHYYYTQGATDEPVKDAFKNWIGIYNLSLIMTYLSFGLLALQSYQWPGADSDYQVLAFRHVAGCLLIALHGWTARETFCVLGDFGWFVRGAIGPPFYKNADDFVPFRSMEISLYVFCHLPCATVLEG